MTRALPLALLALLLAAAPASAMQRFKTPSGRIQCGVFSKADGIAPQVRCDLFFLNDRAAVLRTSGRAKLVKVTDTVGDPKAPVLAYGRSRRFGPFTCTSRRSGLTCRHRASGHGFRVSRERRELF